MNNPKEVTPRELTSWLQQNISEDELIFDKCANIFEIIVNKLNNSKIELAVENKVLMIKLCKYLYENSHH